MKANKPATKAELMQELLTLGTWGIDSLNDALVFEANDFGYPRNRAVNILDEMGFEVTTVNECCIYFDYADL